MCTKRLCCKSEHSDMLGAANLMPQDVRVIEEGTFFQMLTPGVDGSQLPT